MKRLVNFFKRRPRCCMTCRYSQKKMFRLDTGSYPKRLCRRYPPAQVLIPERTSRGLDFDLRVRFPVVADDDVCGEYKR